MKNQYVADIGDYGKYSLLKAFEDAGIYIGINWYLTKNDNSNDGSIVKYLSDARFRDFCPAVYDSLKDIYYNQCRNVECIEKSDIFKHAVFYNNYIDGGKSVEKKDYRISWHKDALERFTNTELVFLDPDNGLLANEKNKRAKREKYVLPEEVLAYYNMGHNVVYYCHKGRRTESQWEAYKRTVFELIPYAHPMVLTFHKGTQRSYIFMIHPKYSDEYIRIAKAFAESWNGAFTFESVDMYMLSEINWGLSELSSRRYISENDLNEFLMQNRLTVGNYYDYLTTQPIDVNYELRQIDNADFEMCCVLMTLILREDYFDNGSYERRFKDGCVKRIIDRMIKSAK